MPPKQSGKKKDQTGSNSENYKLLQFDPKPKLYHWKEVGTVANIIPQILSLWQNPDSEAMKISDTYNIARHFSHFEKNIKADLLCSAVCILN